MRTTLTIDDDVAREINRLAARRTKFVVKAQHCGFRPGIDPHKLNALYDELETEQFIERHIEAKKPS